MREGAELPAANQKAAEHTDVQEHNPKDAKHSRSQKDSLLSPRPSSNL
jgi:hypothetical protein